MGKSDTLGGLIRAAEKKIKIHFWIAWKHAPPIAFVARSKTDA